jgi:hypothetical protein
MLVLMSLLHIQLPFFLVFGAISIYILGYAVIQAFKNASENKRKEVPAKLDQAERGDVIKQHGLTANDQFELEKRAFLSKVRETLSTVPKRVPWTTSPQKCLTMRRFRSNTVADMALRLSSQPLRQNRRLPYVRDHWDVVLRRLRQGLKVACVPQHLSTSGVHRGPQVMWHINAFLLQIPWMAVR